MSQFVLLVARLRQLLLQFGALPAQGSTQGPACDFKSPDNMASLQSMASRGSWYMGREEHEASVMWGKEEGLLVQSML